MNHAAVRHIWRPLVLLALFLVPIHIVLAQGPVALTAALLAQLSDGDTNAKLQVISKLGQLKDPAAARVLKALGSDQLVVSPAGKTLILLNDAQAWDPLSRKKTTVPEGVDTIVITNRLRRAINNALAATDLFSDSPETRLAAAKRMQHNADVSISALLADARTAEKDPGVRHELDLALAMLDIKSDDASIRARAVELLGGAGNGAFRTVLTDLLTQRSDETYVEPDPSVRDAATAALRQLDRHLSLTEWAGNLFYGISLGSVLILAALGLAITFGLMGVINMAHGELLMIGAYATYLTQLLFRHYIPTWIDWYVIAALPVAFLITACVGMALERTVIRWLYGRPLETLLATWGISLILMQAVRTVFGAQNVEVANPSWMSGGVTVLGGLVLSYNRLAIIFFSLIVIFFVWLLLNHTRLGLFVRAIIQNRNMADCVGVPTGRVDMLAFGLGSGIAGLGGVALSQLGNVGPDLGRAYLVDSFMVVVLGGVGQLAGTVIAALGLGSLNKFLEPWAGAVLAKISILVLIVLFVQKRPQGLFAPRGRSTE